RAPASRPPGVTRAMRPTRHPAAPVPAPAGRCARGPRRRGTRPRPLPPARRLSTANRAVQPAHSVDPSALPTVNYSGGDSAIGSFSTESRTYLSALGPGNHGLLDRAYPGLLAVLSGAEYH